MAFLWAHTPEFKDMYGKIMNNSIAESKMIKIRDSEQFVLIRGVNKDNPILLIIHGGPGSPETALFRYYNEELEKNFVVCYWEQRECGKSYKRELKEKQMTIRMFIDDVHDITKYLKSYLNKEKIFILAHSWGTLLGTMAVYEHPESYYAYVGTGQVSDMAQSEYESYKFALDSALKSNNKKAVRELTKIGEPHDGVYKCGTNGTQIERKYLGFFGGSIYKEKGIMIYLKKILSCKEYNIIDIKNFLLGMSCPARNKMSHDEFLKINLFDYVDEIKIPIYFFLGRHDHQVSSTLAEKFFKYIKCSKKVLVWFENSAHSSCFEEPKKFNDLMVNKVLKERL